MSFGRVSELQAPEQLGRRLVHGGIVEDLEGADAAGELAAEEDVHRRAQIVAERQVLVDDLDAVLTRLDGPVEYRFAVLDEDLAARRPEVSGDHLHQRRLAGAVVAHQADDLAGRQRHRDVVERVNRPEML